LGFKNRGIRNQGNNPYMGKKLGLLRGFSTKQEDGGEKKNRARKEYISLQRKRRERKFGVTKRGNADFLARLLIWMKTSDHPQSKG